MGREKESPTFLFLSSSSSYFHFCCGVGCDPLLLRLAACLSFGLLLLRIGKSDPSPLSCPAPTRNGTRHGGSWILFPTPPDVWSHFFTTAAVENDPEKAWQGQTSAFLSLFFPSLALTHCLTRFFLHQKLGW